MTQCLFIIYVYMYVLQVQCVIIIVTMKDNAAARFIAIRSNVIFHYLMSFLLYLVHRSDCSLIQTYCSSFFKQTTWAAVPRRRHYEATPTTGSVYNLDF